MGTSHRHKPSVTGEPNWGNASTAVTSIATAEKKRDELDKELEGSEVANNSDGQDDEDNKKTASATHPSQIAKRQRQLDNQIRRNYHKAVRYLVKASGGRSVVSSGKSRAVGHAGVNLLSGFVSAISEIVKNGLTDWLGRRGIKTLEGISCQDVLALIRNYIEEGVAGLDNTAANEALEYVLDDLGQKIGDDLNSFEEVMNTLMASDEIKDLIDKFFGMYIYSHLSQDFKEKLEYEKGSKVMNETMNDIKDFIMDDIQRCRSGRDSLSIDWGADEGKAFVQAEFDKILFILSGNED